MSQIISIGLYNKLEVTFDIDKANPKVSYLFHSKRRKILELKKN